MDSRPAAEGLRLRHKTGSVGEPREAEKTESKTKSKTTQSTASKVHAQVAAAQVSDIISLLLAFRFINALCVRTFFQPDEYFQALEPAWRIAFGADSGAWLTWVHFLDSPRLRSTNTGLG
jgi:phosphatidylinositol glycan class B